MKHSVEENRHCIHGAHVLLSVLIYLGQSIRLFFELPCPGENDPGRPVQCLHLILMMRTSRDVPEIPCRKSQNHSTGIPPFSSKSVRLDALAVLLLDRERQRLSVCKLFCFRD